MKQSQQLESLALIVHTSTALLNVLIAIYNKQRGNNVRAVFHCGLVLYEVHALTQHIPKKGALS